MDVDTEHAVQQTFLSPVAFIVIVYDTGSSLHPNLLFHVVYLHARLPPQTQDQKVPTENHKTTSSQIAIPSADNDALYIDDSRVANTFSL